MHFFRNTEEQHVRVVSVMVFRSIPAKASFMHAFIFTFIDLFKEKPTEVKEIDE